MPESSPTEKRFEELDGLRGVAALWVVIYHLTYGLKARWLEGQDHLVAEYVPFSASTINGQMAVHLFFIISGFVISMTVARTRVPLDFAVSRFARLFPAYWAAAAAAVAVNVLAPLPIFPVTLDQTLANFTMLQLFLGYVDVDPSYWSLAFELGFYAIIGIALVAGLQRRLEGVGFFWMLAGAFLPLVCDRLGHPLPWRVQAAVVGGFAPLFYAGLLYYRGWSDRFTLLRALGIALCLGIGVYLLPPRLQWYEVMNFALFTAAVSGRFLLMRTRLMVFLGTISYCLYLTHQTLAFRTQRAFHAAGLSPWMNLAATLLVVISAATLLTFAVERPAGRWIRSSYSMWKRRRAAAAIA
jgi:peptidoglycan/LPS O-acetylase OafA/YrhL